MYAVVKTGGKQYRVAKDDKIVVDRLMGEDGETVVLDQVLMMADGDKVTVGAPVIEGAVSVQRFCARRAALRLWFSAASAARISAASVAIAKT